MKCTTTWVGFLLSTITAPELQLQQCCNFALKREHLLSLVFLKSVTWR